jgi:membrane-bound metal-dependent hydrolase YbcI (DUF457 family)
MPTILQSPFFTELVLPFLLVFVLIFAILDKIKIFGEGKRQINAIISLVIALIFVSFYDAVGITVQLMGFLAIVSVILLVFLMLYGFAGGGELKEEKWMKITFGVLVGLALVILLLYLTGYLGVVAEALTGGKGSELALNILFVIIIVAAVVIVLVGKGKGGGGGGGSGESTE